jgi:phospholipase/carboxylesterase
MESLNAPMVYEVRKPKEMDPSKKYPALFLIHGKGSNERNMFDLTEGLEDDFFIFSIRGHIPHPPGYAFFTFQIYGYPDREGFDEGIGLITNFLDYASENYPIDKDYLYVLGFSQGAVLAMTLALTLGHKIKGIMALSGYIPQFVKEDYSIKPVNKVSVFISHGKEDPVLPYEWGEWAQEYFAEKRANVTFYSYEVGHQVSRQNQEDMKQWLLNDIR